MRFFAFPTVLAPADQVHLAYSFGFEDLMSCLVNLEDSGLAHFLAGLMQYAVGIILRSTI